MDTNFWGPWRVTQAFAPMLARNGGGALVNVLSVLSWISLPGTATYCVSKACGLALTNGLRNELREQGTQRDGRAPGTDGHRHDGGHGCAEDLAEGCRRADRARAAGGREEVLADETSRQVKASLSSAQAAYLTTSAAG